MIMKKFESSTDPDVQRIPDCAKLRAKINNERSSILGSKRDRSGLTDFIVDKDDLDETSDEEMPPEFEQCPNRAKRFHPDPDDGAPIAAVPKLSPTATPSSSAAPYPQSTYLKPTEVDFKLYNDDDDDEEFDIRYPPYNPLKSDKFVVEDEKLQDLEPEVLQWAKHLFVLFPKGTLRFIQQRRLANSIFIGFSLPDGWTPSVSTSQSGHIRVTLKPTADPYVLRLDWMKYVDGLMLEQAKVKGLAPTAGTFWANVFHTDYPPNVDLPILQIGDPDKRAILHQPYTTTSPVWTLQVPILR